MVNEKIKISVIVPVYGTEKYIERCVRSLMEQTMTDGIEFIFVDDCTPDHSVEIIEHTIKEYPHRLDQVCILHHENNMGLTCARNTGLSHARGEYICHCDSDDYVDKSMYLKLYQTASTGNYDMVYCDFYFDYGNTSIREYMPAVKDNKIEMLKTYISSGWTIIPVSIFKKDIYDRYHIKSNESISFCEDYELTARLLGVSESWTKINEALYYYVQSNYNSIVKTSLSSKKRKKTIDDEIKACKSVYDFMTSLGLKDSLLEELSWRNLKAKRGLIYPEFNRIEFNKLWPEAIQYVDSMPLCSKTDQLSLKLASSKYLWPLVYIINILRTIATNSKIKNHN